MILSYDMILENFVRTDREQTDNSKTEATLILCGSSGERANKKVRNFQITIILVHRYSFSQRFYEPQRPYTAKKN